MKALKGLRIKFLYAAVLSAFLLTACSSAVTETTPGASETPTPSATTAGSTDESDTENGELALVPISVEFAAEDEDISWSYASATKILLNGDSATVEGSGAKAEGSTVTITGGGTYVVSGTLTDGKLVVDSSDKNTVKIVLNEAHITNGSDAALHVLSAEKTMIVLADETENTLEDGATRASLDDSGEPDGALFSKDDLVIAGNGSLTVKANYDDGIVSKDGLWITGGKITVDAAGDGIRGKDFLVVKVADITVTSEGEALKSTQDSDSEKGYIYIESGIFTIDSQQDAIEAVTQVIIKSGDFNIKAGGGSENGVSKTGNAGGNFPGGGNTTNAETDTVSTKGIKADVGITIDGGTFNIDTADDAIHTNNSIVINGGVFNITTGDDCIHSDTVMTLHGGEITILTSYEGIESANVTINDGIIRVTASDDGINIAGGNDGSSVNGRPGQNSFTQGGNYLLTINGGYITVDAGGDGLDSNGSIVMEDGIVIVNGPTNSGNGALDYDGTFTLNGGYLVAAGSAGMAQAPSDSSSQASMLVGFDSTLQAGTVIRVEDASGKAILTFAPSKEFQTFVLSSPELKSGSQYSVYYGGSSSGIVEDGLYSEGTYSGGTKLMDITLSGTVTTAGTTGGGFGGGFGGGGGRR